MLNFPLPRISAMLLSLCVLNTAFAVPQINRLSQHGFTIGQPVTVTIDGADLAEAPLIVSSLPITSQQVQPNPQANQITLQFTIGEQASPGIYTFRLATKSGISNGVLVSVDLLNHQLWSGEIAALPISFLGGIQKYVYAVYHHCSAKRA